MKIKKWKLFCESLDDSANPPKFSDDQVNWLDHSFRNPLNFIKNFSQLNIELLEDGELSKEDMEDVKSNQIKIKKHSDDIEKRLKNVFDNRTKNKIGVNKRNIPVKSVKNL